MKKVQAGVICLRSSNIRFRITLKHSKRNKFSSWKPVAVRKAWIVSNTRKNSKLKNYCSFFNFFFKPKFPIVDFFPATPFEKLDGTVFELAIIISND